MPLVWQADPDLVCVLAGSRMPAEIRHLDGPRVRVLGHVADLGTVYDQVRLTVAPLRYGAGVKGKVLHSLAAGVPCVGTSISVEGIDVPQALSALIADTPAELAAAILRLHRDQAACGAAAAAGLTYVRESASSARVDGLMQRAVQPIKQRIAERAG